MAAKILAEKAITLPFSISSYGRVADTTSSEKIWADKVRSAIGTLINERVMRPRFGTKVPVHVFDNQTEVAEKIKQEISAAFTAYLGQLTLSSINVTLDSSTSTVSVEVTYKIPTGLQTSLTVGLASLTGNSPINEENTW